MILVSENSNDEGAIIKYNDTKSYGYNRQIISIHTHLTHTLTLAQVIRQSIQHKYRLLDNMYQHTNRYTHCNKALATRSTFNPAKGIVSGLADINIHTT